MSWTSGSGTAAGQSVLSAALCGILLLVAGAACARTGLPPRDGGRTHSLGMPPVYKGRAGFEAGVNRPEADGALASYFNLGLGKSLGSPVVGIAGLLKLSL